VRRGDEDWLDGLAEGTEEHDARVPALVASADGRHVRLRGGAELTLMRRRAPRLVLLRLLEERMARPGSALGTDELLAAGWPGERVLPQSGQARVYVAVSTLRRLGLGRLIVHRGDGYLLDPDEDVRFG
jgi:hypothetical protein